MKTLLIIFACSIFFQGWALAQTVTQTVKGKVTDQVTQEELIGVTVTLIGSDPIIGSVTGLDGTFTLKNVPVGRHSFEFRMIGYESSVAREILVSSGKELVLDMALGEAITTLDEIVVTYTADKNKAINEMIAVSGRQFTVEETQRYAGGLNDPARLVTSFAGVASPSISSNGISVRGNSPSGLLWRIEGVEVPSPNHFADLSVAGAGLLTALSSQVLNNSDFMTGAFPAEYGNATSGVFDMKLRSGNPSKREHTAQIGVLGVDFATEGPFKKGKGSTYLLNYRYSTLALVSPLLPDDSGVLKYQDLSYKVDLPTKNAGKFSFWGLGAYDGVNMNVPDSTEWEPDTDRDNSQTSMYMYASGLNHKINIGDKALLQTSLAASGHGMTFDEQYVQDNLEERVTADVQKNNYKLTLQSSLSTFWGDKHYNKSGFYVNYLGYDLDIMHEKSQDSVLSTYVNSRGNAALFQFYSQSQFELSHKFTLNAGFHSQYFQLNKGLTFEPRVSLKYQLSPKSNLAAAYGMHSKTESLGLYFIRDEQGYEPNRGLKFMKSQHFVLSYNTQLNEYIGLSIEPYYQYLTNIPVALDGYVSTINNQDNLFFNELLVSEGTGKNIGVDVTLEHYLKNGFYGLLTASVFDSKYTANDGIERNTRLNKNYVFNAVFGKEWQVGRHNNDIFSANIRLNYLGGNRAEAVDLSRSIEQQEVVYGETDGGLSFSERFRDTPIWSYTVSYRKNKPNYSSVWSLQVLNASTAQEHDYNSFNVQTQKVDRNYLGIMVPNLSYKIEF